jgi:hypothetical protein
MLQTMVPGQGKKTMKMRHKKEKLVFTVHFFIMFSF